MSAPVGAPRRVLVALAGTEDPALVAQVARVVGGRESAIELTLLHVEETGPRELAAHGLPLRSGPWPARSGDAVEQRLAEADDLRAAALLEAWHDRFAAALPDAGIAHLVARGRPEQEIVAAAGRLAADVLVLCARPRTGPTEAGPRSLGHVSRFVVDHSPVPVLVVRRSR
ncbi:MAG: universal stress protein [Candidatus Limnocylindrales bacterium]|jgi:nucleotide-binding universal stress UspA family protein